METSFASAVIYVGRQTSISSNAIVAIAEELAELFKAYEIIVVDDDCTSDKAGQIVSMLSDCTCSVVRMGNPQGVEAAMNAGVDAAVGDYVYEIDDIGATPPSFIEASFRETEEGADVVNGIPTSGSSKRSRLFYTIFNHFSGYPSKLASNPCRLVSRRALNRMRSMSDYSPYRKASYAASGLKTAEILVAGNTTRQTNIDTAVTSLALYTSAFYRAAIWLAAIMAIASLLELVYVIVVTASGMAITGWATTMFALTLGFMVVFVLFAFTLKYLDLLVRICFEKQGYLTDGIERPDCEARR